jgi:hypothetical protein
LSDRITTGAFAVPDAVAPIIDVMSSYSGHWALCGGWAVDAWLGRLSREHGDVDVSVLVEDQGVLFRHLVGWKLMAGEPEHTSWDGTTTLGTPGHIHAGIDTGGALPDVFIPQTGFPLDIQLDDRTGADWVLSRDPFVSMAFAEAVRPSPWGVPAAAPEVLLFFKARDLRRRDHADFHALLPLLSNERRAWLRDAIERLRHPWASPLEA